MQETKVVPLTLIYFQIEYPNVLLVQCEMIC